MNPGLAAQDFQSFSVVGCSHVELPGGHLRMPKPHVLGYRQSEQCVPERQSFGGKVMNRKTCLTMCLDSDLKVMLNGAEL